MKKLLSLFLTFCLLTTMVACSSKKNEVSVTKSSAGFAGEVSVTVVVTDGVLSDVSIIGENETPEYGGKAIETLTNAMKEAKSVEVDAVTGSTATSNAVLMAAKEAFNEAIGGNASGEVKMAPGIYVVEANGFSLLYPMEVEVVVTETSIESIKVLENAETYPFVKAAEDRIVPRIIENQSLAVDAITGATGSSNGIKSAVDLAIKEALVKGGSQESAISNFYGAIAKSDKKETIDVEVLVVGLGGAGTAAAMSAVETQHEIYGDASKVSVLAIDKAGKYGGTSCITADTMAINAPEYAKEHNDGQDFVDAAAMKKAWMEFTMGDAKEEALDLFFEESGPTVDWLISHGFIYGDPQTGFTSEDIWAVKHQYTGQGYGNWKKETGEMYDSIMNDYTELGGKYMLEVEATELIYDETTKTVKGVKAVGYDGTEYTINAEAVIMGTGGFSKNSRLQEEYLKNDFYPLKGTWQMYGMQQNDGKLFESALNIGSGTYNIGMPPMVHLQGAPITLRDYPVEQVGDGSVGFWSQLPSTWSLNDFPNALAGSGAALQVNKDGERFSNEAGTFQTWKSGPYYYTVWSEETFKDIQTNGLALGFSDDLTAQGGIPANKPIPEVFDVIDLCIEKGIAYKADTIEELAKLVNMDPATLQATITKYNESCAKGVDEEFGKPAKSFNMFTGEEGPSLLVPIPETGPFYLFKGASFIYSTVGGLDVNTDIQVLDTNNEVINGLYAAGTDSLGVLFSEQREYVTYGGAAQGWAYTSGRLAGIHAANAVSK